MATEFTFYNSGGELTLSADGITYGFIGRATLSTISQASSGPVSRSAGSSVYSIDWGADILVALPLKANGTTALIGAGKSGTTWTITVHKGNGTFNVDGFDVQEATEVYVFGAPVAGTLSILNLFDVNGVVCADLSRQPLTYKGIVSMGANVLNAAIPAAAVRAIVGSPCDYKVTSVTSGASFINRIFGRGWQLNSSTGRIERNQVLLSWAKDDGASSPVDEINPIDAILIEAAGL